ncbi:globin [Virgibacillus soli]|uniref:Globin n=1 Tax=Lederbergia galactosidilytica TaxID=217031 RepID=A0A0Q9Y4Q1_9BACI|nr:globin [Lederbergia galactosidilytica]KRG10871.1 globin [Lederbergia galactosidilytica]KRG15962.1 globin [Virgibacillus soli]MBP1915660.1 hemoglobin [Lederbergia galactosidilytica]
MVEMKMTPYDAIGEKKLHKLVEQFYLRVGKHPELTPIFPDDLTEVARKQKQFLTQFLGGPKLYTEEHGHPMLRARHLPHEITPSRAKAWLACMSEAMDEVDIEPGLRELFYTRLALTAKNMVNTHSPNVMQGEVL